MTERVLPILFSGNMVRAILEGRKTRTMRPLKPQPKSSGKIIPYPYKDGIAVAFWLPAKLMPLPRTWTPPYRPGDTLYVRETWAHCVGVQDQTGDYYTISVDVGKGTHYAFRAQADIDEECWDEDFSGPWRPSIHMPKVAARLWLRVTRVIVQRVPRLTYEDALHEGFQSLAELHAWWSKVYGTGNDWAWVIEFELQEDGRTHDDLPGGVSLNPLGPRSGDDYTAS